MKRWGWEFNSGEICRTIIQTSAGDSLERDRRDRDQIVPAWIAVQSAGKVVDDATKDLSVHRLEEAKSKVTAAIAALKRYGKEGKLRVDLKLMESFLEQLKQGPLSARTMKSTAYSSAYYRRSKTSALWTGTGAATPTFLKTPSVEKQLEDPNHPTPVKETPDGTN